MGERKRILVVDDRPRARHSLRVLLSTWAQVGEIREAGNGQEALAVAETFQPDVVLMDVRMPEMDGLEATRQIKARWPETRVVLLSGYAAYGDAAFLAGAESFAPKSDLAIQLRAILGAIAPESD